SARDVVNQAGMVASNVMNGDEAICHTEELLLGASDQVVLDVRNPPELEASGVFPNALNIPLDALRDRLYTLPVDKEILVACQVGLRGHVAYRMLVQNGFQARNLTGGYKTYQMVTDSF
ncbi:TPA: rhodanese-like domain-containing protein, partial [Aeromonas hydrophila]